MPNPPTNDENSEIYQRGMEEIRKQLGPMADTYIKTIKSVAQNSRG